MLMPGWSRLAGQIEDGDVSGVPRNAGSGGTLDEFLVAAHVEVVDVTRGAAAGTRRLLLGEPHSRSVSYSVAVADGAPWAPALDHEVRFLTELRGMVSPPVLATLPSLVASVTVGERPGVVMTASGPVPRYRRGPAADPDALEAVCDWLDALWRDTAGPTGPVDLGRQAADLLLARWVGVERLAPVLSAVHRARRRVARQRTRRTAAHGRLCPQRVYVRDGAVLGVDDWGRAGLDADPLRDLGGFAVRHAGPRLADVVADRAGPTRRVGDFVRAGLAATGLPESGWRDVLVLAQAERTVDALERGRADEIGLLVAAADALPPEPDEPWADR
jgi:hypothetical protein